MTTAGLEAVFFENRDRLLRFLAAHGAGDAAEDLLQELWLRISAAPQGPVGQPLAYLYRAANNLMVDRHRANRTTERRDREWSDATGSTAPGISDTPGGERTLIAREHLRQAEAALAALGPRAETAFRRHRIDGIAQRDIAVELGVSLSTVEADLRRAYRAMIELRSRLDAE
ncbi:RNA polymerase subunit sigma-24 [Sphingomonas sp. DBB INV C78]|uniref:sigma-70 family RNA polymerase sigma factor n=1 Tax=Sphingomonas sp. DBB INV C78 TaxID=3349434 RepID=UPI0036D34B14